MWGGVVEWNPPNCSMDSKITQLVRKTISPEVSDNFSMFSCFLLTIFFVYLLGWVSVGYLAIFYLINVIIFTLPWHFFGLANLLGFTLASYASVLTVNDIVEIKCLFVLTSQNLSYI